MLIYAIAVVAEGEESQLVTLTGNKVLHLFCILVHGNPPKMQLNAIRYKNSAVIGLYIPVAVAYILVNEQGGTRKSETRRNGLP